MGKPVLVGYDPRGDDRAPVAWGAAAARFTGAPLIVAAVQSGGAPGTDDDLVDDCAAAIAGIERELEREGLSARCIALRSTSAARALHEAAEAEDAGLLVVGSTRRSVAGRVLPGATAERLLHGAPCPIAVVPRAWARNGAPSVIGVAYVDTPEGREALHGAHALARRAGAILRVVHVVRVRPTMYAEIEPNLPARHGKELEDVEGEHKLAAERAIRAVLGELGDDAGVELDVPIGDPAATIIDVSEHLDLLVCGSRGYGPVRAVLLGSVSRQVVSEARCPVIVLPRGVSASLQALVEQEPVARQSAPQA